MWCARTHYDKHAVVAAQPVEQALVRVEQDWEETHSYLEIEGATKTK